MTDRPSVLVPVEVLEGESIPEGVPKLLANAHVVLLGYHVIPEQTAPGQAQMQFEEQALDRIEEFEQMFEGAGATVDHRLVFTHEGQKTIDRMIAEHECLAVLVPNATEEIEDVLVAVRGTVGLDRLSRVVAGLFGEAEATITLYHVAGTDESDEDVDLLLDGLETRLTEKGVAESRILTRIEREGDAMDAITDAATEYDVVVMGESDPSMATFIFGMPAEQVAERFLGPVLVVQRTPPQTEPAE